MSKAVDADVLSTAVRQTVIEQFQADSLLSYFAMEPIPDGIAASTWALRYMEATQKAAWTTAGYTPNHVTSSFKGGEFEIDTISQEMTLSERDLAFDQAHGFFSPQVSHIGGNLAWTSNKVLFDGLDENDISPHSGQYNYISDLGSGAGTAIRPIMSMNKTTGGAWSTFANAQGDITAALGGLVSKGYNAATTFCFYPLVLAPLMMRVLTEQRDESIGDYINRLCAGHIAIDGDFISTDREGTPTTPTATDAEIYFVDVKSIVIGIARAERVRVIGPYGTVRDTAVEAEIWMCPLMIPTPKQEAGTDKFYKGVAVIDGVSQ